jgi:hypothetical protein
MHLIKHQDSLKELLFSKPPICTTALGQRLFNFPHPILKNLHDQATSPQLYNNRHPQLINYYKDDSLLKHLPGAGTEEVRSSTPTGSPICC